MPGNRRGPPARNTILLSDDQLTELFRAVRRRSLDLAEPLSAEDQCIQSMPDVSPTKWHLAHVTWFFETFILKPHAPGYREFHPDYDFLFNSYYEAIGPRHARPHRGLLSRPSAEDILAFRAHVEEALEVFFLNGGSDNETIRGLVELGCHHEQQHQELLLTDIKHVLSSNPLNPAYQPPRPRDAGRTRTLDWVEHPGGLVEIGHNGEGFAFDCEGPRHKVWLEPFRLASRPVSNGEYLAFIEDGGYSRPELWLSDGWAAIKEHGWEAPLYWRRQEDGAWKVFTLAGLRPMDPDAPVCHVSFYEADAYAAWAGKRLPAEAEWEVIAAPLTPAGNFAGARSYHPVPAMGEGLRQIYGDVWEWTASAYRPYSGFAAAEGAVGEYNGKFMSGRMVLRGGSCATPEGHVRASYRNFFYPPDRWQFSGIRLAEDARDARLSIPSLTRQTAAEEAPLNPVALAFLNDVVMGLSMTPKALPPKWFYDEAGAGIFNEICQTPEYYPTRTELGILTDNAKVIADGLGEKIVLIEFGSGSMTKARKLLDALDAPAAFVPIDISEEQLEAEAAELNAAYPGLEVRPIAQDFTKPVKIPADLGGGRRCAFFPGSTIGNFEPENAVRLMSRMRKAVGGRGALVIGVDMKKDRATLEAAYDDPAGTSARFNKNMLERINGELGGDADVEAFEHWAPYNEEEGRIEMHLRAKSAQTVMVAGHEFHFEAGETIHTENSYKFTVDEFKALAARAGFENGRVWTDGDGLFSVFLFDAV